MDNKEGRWIANDVTVIRTPDKARDMKEAIPQAKRFEQGSIAVQSYWQRYPSESFSVRYPEEVARLESKDLQIATVEQDRDELKKSYDILDRILTYEAKQPLLPTYEVLRDLEGEQMDKLAEDLTHRFPHGGELLAARLITISDKAKMLEETLQNVLKTEVEQKDELAA